MDYICNTIEEFNEALRIYEKGDVFICSDVVWEYVKEVFDIGARL